MNVTKMRRGRLALLNLDFQSIIMNRIKQISIDPIRDQHCLSNVMHFTSPFRKSVLQPGYPYPPHQLLLQR